MLPDPLIAFFDSALNALNDCSWSKIVLDGLLLWVTCDSPNQLENVKVFGTFHRFFQECQRH